MKTKTYDLNLYVIDGHVKILAHQLERNVYNELITGSTFHVAFDMQLKRANRAIWQPIVDFFTGEKDTKIYNELDEWHCTSVESATRPYSKLPKSYLNSMPVVLDIVVEELPEYDV